MKTKRKVSGQHWEFDGSAITVRIPMTWKRHGGRKVIIRTAATRWAPAKPRPDETLIRALARAHRWKRMLEERSYRSAGELAEAEGVTRGFVCVGKREGQDFVRQGPIACLTWHLRVRPIYV